MIGDGASAQTATRRRRPEELRQLLVEAAIEQFAARGYAATTNKNVAETAGVSLSVLYRQFASKSDLFCAAVLAPLVDFLDGWRAGDREHFELDFESLMRLFLGQFYAAMGRHRGALNGIVAASGDLPDDVKHTLRVAFDGTFEQLHMLALAEATRHTWYSTDGLEPVGRVLLAAVLGMVTYDWLLDPPGEDVAGSKLLDTAAKLTCWGFTREPPQDAPPSIMRKAQSGPARIPR